MRLGSFATVFAIAVIVIACSSSSPSDEGSRAPDGSSPPALPDSSTTPDKSKPGMKLARESMQVAGNTHTYALAVPDNYDASRAYPLVMVLHGNPGNADQMLQGAPFDVASGQDAILAYPEGIGNNWDLSTPPESNKDFAFIKVLADEIAKKYNIDKSRVFASGYSGGGFFLNQFNCRVPNVFKAFASHAGGAPFPMNGEPASNDCPPCPAGPIPAIHTHGRNDTGVGTDSGYYAAVCSAKTNACSSSEANAWPATAPTPCQTAPGCAQHPVILCWVEGLGHSAWEHASTAAWGLFQSLP